MSIFRNRHWFDEIAFIARFIRDYLTGVAIFRSQTPCVTVYGSAVFPVGHPLYDQAKTLGSQLAQAGYTVMTGGGPGLMEAANLGAQSHGQSLGCAIRIPTEQALNPYLDRSLVCHYFGTRKLLLTRFSCGFIALPGGFGTLDELFEMVTLVKTEHMAPFPIVLLGKAYWKPMMTFIENSLLKEGAITKDELATITLTDSVEEAVACMRA